MEIYQPAEDSWFFSEFLKDYIQSFVDRDISYCDIGTGSGILAETAFNSGVLKENILCVDINPLALEIVKKKGFNVLKSDLFENMNNEKFDLITFNTPYLPEHEYDSLPDTTGGKKGDEVTLRFIEQAKKHLKENGKCFFLVSSHTPLEEIKKHGKIVAKKKIFFEELLIFELD